MELLLQQQKPVGFRLGQRGHRDAGTVGDHGGHILRSHGACGVTQVPAPALGRELQPEVPLRVPQHGGLFKVLAPNGLLLFQGRPVGLLLQAAEGGGSVQLAHAHPRGGFVDEVDGLIRKETVRQIAAGECDGSLQGLVRNAQAMVGLISVPQAPEDRKRCGAVRFLDHDLLEAAFQGGVLFDIFPVFVQRGAPTT